MLSAEASSAICVQRFDDSRYSAIHTTYRISLRSSSLREPRYPLLRVVSVRMHRPGRVHLFFRWFRFGVGCLCLDRPRPKPGPDPDGKLMPPGRLRELPIGGPDSSVHGVGIDRFNDPSAGSPTETLLRLLLPLGGRV